MSGKRSVDDDKIRPTKTWSSAFFKLIEAHGHTPAELEKGLNRDKGTIDRLRRADSRSSAPLALAAMRYAREEWKLDVSRLPNLDGTPSPGQTQSMPSQQWLDEWVRMGRLICNNLPSERIEEIMRPVKAAAEIAEGIEAQWNSAFHPTQRDNKDDD